MQPHNEVHTSFQSCNFLFFHHSATLRGKSSSRVWNKSIGLNESYFEGWELLDAVKW